MNESIISIFLNSIIAGLRKVTAFVSISLTIAACACAITFIALLPFVLLSHYIGLQYGTWVGLGAFALVLALYLPYLWLCAFLLECIEKFYNKFFNKSVVKKDVEQCEGQV